MGIGEAATHSQSLAGGDGDVGDASAAAAAADSSFGASVMSMYWNCSCIKKREDTVVLQGASHDEGNLAYQ
uniref:Uncharacterized protein n=1 Tax=Oryza meridionalis TaxID=40149 RepID=A0A0E0CRZ8_9ORYZ